MKNLKLSTFFVTLLFALLISSCTQENITPVDEKASIDLQELASQISQSENYQGINEIRKYIFDDLANFYETNHSEIKENPSFFENHLSTYTEHEEELTTYVNNLRNEVPAILTITEDEFDKVLELANLQITQRSESCWDICHDLYLDCDAVCYRRYLLFETFTYHDYLTCNGICLEFVFYDCLENDC